MSDSSAVIGISAQEDATEKKDEIRPTPVEGFVTREKGRPNLTDRPDTGTREMFSLYEKER